MTTARRKIKGCEPLLSVNDIAALSRRPRRAVLRLLKDGALRGIRLGGNSWRVRQEDWRKFTGGDAVRPRREQTLTLDELAELAGRPRRFIFKLVRSGELKGVRHPKSRSVLVRKKDWNRFIGKGAACFSRARSSGGIRPGMYTRKRGTA